MPLVVALFVGMRICFFTNIVYDGVVCDVFQVFNKHKNIYIYIYMLYFYLYIYIHMTLHVMCCLGLPGTYLFTSTIA
jgi:hypothetical protein